MTNYSVSQSASQPSIYSTNEQFQPWKLNLCFCWFYLPTPSPCSIDPKIHHLLQALPPTSGSQNQHSLRIFSYKNFPLFFHFCCCCCRCWLWFGFTFFFSFFFLLLLLQLFLFSYRKFCLFLLLFSLIWLLLFFLYFVILFCFHFSLQTKVARR